MKKRAVAVAVLLVSILIACAPSGKAPAPSEKVIKIGILGALTGPLRSIGEGAIGVYDYFTDLNVTDGGVKYTDPKTGKEEVVRLELIMGDHAWDAAKSLSLYERFKAAGVQFIFCNGSAPTAVLYKAAARDHIPGLHVDCTCDPYIYELEKPYLAMNTSNLPAGLVALVARHVYEWKRAGNTGKLKLGILAADVPTRRVMDNPEWGVPDYLNRILGADLEWLGTVYIPVAPVDVKAELNTFIQKGVQHLMVEHWGSGACRVVINDALALGMHKKGITLDIDWLPADVPLAEPQLFEEYNRYAKVRAYSHGWSGTEPPEILAKYPGLKKAYDVCAKYHQGQTPEQRMGWYYIYGVKEAMLGHQAIKKTLEKHGWEGFSGPALRDEIFGLSPLDTGGIMPTYYPDPKYFMTLPGWTICDIRGGHIITNMPWVMVGKTKVYPDLTVKVADDWTDKVWFPPDWRP